MTATVRIPTPLRGYAGGAAELALEGADVRSALDTLRERHAGLVERLLDPTGALRPFVNLYLGPTDVRELDGLATRLRAGDVLTVLPAVAGGRAR